MSFKVDTSGISNGLKGMTERDKAALAMLAYEWAPILQGYAQRNAPWENRTGAARDRLTGSVERVTDEIYRIKLSHGVDYGKWLELAHEKKYAILAPTVKLLAPVVKDDLKKIMS